MTTIINIYDESNPKDDKDVVYIGRPSKWGNPFIIGRDGTREQVIEKYKDWLNKTDSLYSEALDELKDKKLACFCKPLACHGDYLAEITNNYWKSR
jgi:Domain of unknown function (DUF4326)